MSTSTFTMCCMLVEFVIFITIQLDSNQNGLFGDFKFIRHTEVIKYQKLFGELQVVSNF